MVRLVNMECTCNVFYKYCNILSIVILYKCRKSSVKTKAKTTLAKCLRIPPIKNAGSEFLKGSPTKTRG